VIPTILMIGVALLLAIALRTARLSSRRQQRLEHDNHAMRLELERHRQTAQSILRELESP
jgi:hypothetical protein